MREPKRDSPPRAGQPPRASSTLQNHWTARWIFTTRHRAIGVQYLTLSLAAVLLGACLSLAMRTHLAWPDLPIPWIGVLRPEQYLALMTLHGTMMIFFVVTTAPLSGFANLVLPEQIGASRMALPWINAASFWGTALAFVILTASFFAPGGGPISGWTAYPPLSAIPAAGPGQGGGMDLWLASMAVFSVASLLSAINLLATIAGERCRGMTLGRMPLTVWSWMVTAILVLLAFSVLLAALALLFCDRHFGASFFIPSGDLVSGELFRRGNGTPLLWLHLFWFFGHPEVYIAILPGMGLVSSLLANFCRRPVAGYKVQAGGMVAIGLLGFLVWGHHMFVSGLNPYAGTAFSVTTMAIAIPSTAETLSWLATLAGGGVEKNTPMLFSLGFISLFVTGGLTGPILAQPALDSYLHNTYFVVAHFHLIMGMAGVFAIYAGIYYWFPLMSGRLMHEGLGKWHFWLTLLGAYAVFLPMHFTGLAGEPREYVRVPSPGQPLHGLAPLDRAITYAAFVLVLSQCAFLVNLFWSARRGRRASNNPWSSTTMEWLGEHEGAIAIQRGPYDYALNGNPAAFRMQWEPEKKEE